MSERKRTPIAEILEEGPGPAFIKILPGDAITLEAARDHIEICREYAEGRPTALLVDFRVGRPMNRNAQRYFSGREAAEITKALAILVRSRFSRIVATFFLGFGKPAFPVKVFDDEARARAWLREFL